MELFLLVNRTTRVIRDAENDTNTTTTEIQPIIKTHSNKSNTKLGIAERNNNNRIQTKSDYDFNAKL